MHTQTEIRRRPAPFRYSFLSDLANKIMNYILKHEHELEDCNVTVERLVSVKLGGFQNVRCALNELKQRGFAHQNNNAHWFFFESSIYDDPKPPHYPATTIYLMRDKSNGFIKIGNAKNVFKRERIIQAQKPDIETIAAFDGDTEDERALHRHFKHKRLRGEWFSLNAEDIDSIRMFFGVGGDL